MDYKHISNVHGERHLFVGSITLEFLISEARRERSENKIYQTVRDYLVKLFSKKRN
jgi:hypothetical protein